jgi:cytochrome P450
LPPVSWQDSFWAVTGYPEAQEVLSTPDTFSSAYGTGLISDTRPGLHSLNLSDPPLHTRLRTQVDHWIRRARPQYQAGQNPIRDLPRQTLMALLKIQEPHAFQLQRLAIEVARHRPGANQQLLESLAPVACPLDWALEDQLYLKRLLTLASLESTSAALASLARHRPHDLEEMLRLHPPIQRFGRHLLRDTRLGGQSLQAGQRIVVFFAAANRDPRVFSDPDQWKTRKTGHLSFGYGPHRCPGRALALAQLRHLQADPPPSPRRFYASNFSLTPYEEPISEGTNSQRWTPPSRNA